MALRRVQQVKFRQQDANGDSASGWFVHTYEAGLLVEATTYSDSTGTENENPIELDDAGEANIYLDDGLAYRFIIKTPSGATYDDQDNLTGDGGVVSGEGGYPPVGATGDIQYKVGATTFGGDSNLNWDWVAQTLNLVGFLNVDGKINGGTLSGDNTGDQDLSGFVPYVGATANLDLGLNSLLTNFISSTSQFNVSVDNVQKFAVGTNSVFTTTGVSFSSDQVQTPLLNTVNSATPMSLQVGSTEKVLISDTLTDIKTDAEIQGELKLNNNITFLQASQAVISGASIAINTGTFRLVGDGISYDGSTLVAPEITASTKLWSDGDAEISGLTTSGSIISNSFVNTSSSFIHNVDGFQTSYNSGDNRSYIAPRLASVSDFSSELAFSHTDKCWESETKFKTNGATNFGRLSSAPIALLSGDIYFQTTGSIGWYWWNGTDWLQISEGDKPFLDLRTNLGVQHIITQTNVDEDFKGWISSQAGDTNDFSLNTSTGVYTYNGPNSLKFDGNLSVVGTANQTNVNCIFKIYINTGGGFQDVIQSHYPLEFDGSNERSGSQLTTAVLNNGDQLKVTIAGSKLATLTLGYCRKHVREIS